MSDNLEITQDERTKYGRYRSKRNTRQKEPMRIEVWVVQFRAKVANGYVWAKKEQPDSVPDGVWDRYVQFRSYCRLKNKQVPDLETYQRDHMGKVGRNAFGFKTKKGPEKKSKYSPNPICKADIMAIAARAKQIVEEKLRRVA